MILRQFLRYRRAVALLLFLTSSSHARKIYLDCSSVTDGDGSQLHPFSSVNVVNQQTLGAGDSLKIKTGVTCLGTLSPQGSGKLGNPIHLTSYGDGPAPVINGSGSPAAVTLLNQDFWEISDIAVTNPATTIAWRRGILATSDDGTVHQGLYIHNVTVYDVAGETNKATSSEAFIASAAIIVNGTENGSRYDDVHIYDNLVHDCGGGGIKVRVGQMDNRGHGVHVWGNNISYVGGDGIVVSYGESPLIERNHCGFLGYGEYPWTGGNFAGIWVLGCRDAVMRFNAVHDSRMSDIDSEAFDCDWGNEGTCTVEYNYSHDNAGGIFLNCDGCGTSGGARQIVRYNVFQNDCRTFSNGEDVELDFYNNVVYCPDKEFQIAVPPHTNISNNIWVGTMNSTLPTGDWVEWHGNLFQTVRMPTDTAGTDGNPDFVKPGAAKDTIDTVDGYKLRVGSPALLSGVLIADNGGRDFWNNMVSSVERPNIGPYNGVGQ